MLTENPDLLKEKNGEGFTPLHIACHEDKPDCVKAFLCAGQYLQCVTPSHTFFAAGPDLVSGASLRCTYYISKLLSWFHLVPISF